MEIVSQHQPIIYNVEKVNSELNDLDFISINTLINQL
jgi:hypothetical protein